MASKELQVTSPFSSEAVANGTFTKFVSMMVIALLTLAMGTVYIISLYQRVAVPDIFGEALVAGIVFFTKAAGIADGAAISQSVMNTTIPAVTNAIVSVAPTVTATSTMPANMKVSNATTNN